MLSFPGVVCVEEVDARKRCPRVPMKTPSPFPKPLHNRSAVQTLPSFEAALCGDRALLPATRHVV